MRMTRAFIPLWTLAVVAAVAAFLLHLAMRGKTITLGYELGRARAEQARLREVKRVLQVEAASYKTPERVEIVGRTLLGMEPPAENRIIMLPAAVDPSEGAAEGSDDDDGTTAALPPHTPSQATPP
jgi:cell division protein FtsL